MGYPTSVPSFTNKNAGDVIQPAHVNDLQTEVTAIDNGLLGGFAHPIIANAGLQSSNSTVINLNVTGGSTFGARPFMPPPEAAKVYLDSTVTIGSSQLSTISWLAQDFLTNSSVHSTATNPERLTPQSTGIFAMLASVEFTANATNSRQVDILDSSGTLLGSAIQSSHVGALRVPCQALKRFDVTGSYVTCRVTMGAGVSTMSLSTGVGFSWFSMFRL